MKKLFLISLFLGVVSIHAQTTDYDNATTDTWVAGNPANEAVSLVNQIICFLKNATGPNITDFLGKKFKSVVYMDECEQTSGGGSLDASRGTGGSSQNAAQGDSSSNNNAAEEKKDSMIVINDVATRASDSDPIVSKAWVYMPDTDGGGGFDSFDRDIYLENTITSGVSNDNPYGAFTMSYTMTNTEAAWADTLPAGSTLGEGYLNVSGTKAEFIERSFMSSEMQAYADFSQTEEGDVKGVIVKGGTVGGTGGGPAGPGMFKAYYAFNVDKSENLYCEKLLSAEKISFGEPGSIIAAANQDAIITGPTAAIKPIVGDTLTADELSSNGLSTAPKCLSTAASTKKKSVWQYGVYTQAGAEYTGATDTKKAPFPIYDVAGSKELRGYANHWGVHVDYEVSDAEALAANWKNEQDSTDTNIYKLFQNYGKLQKYTNSFLSLNEIHKVRVRLYIGYANSNAERTKFANLGFVDTDWDGADNTFGNADDDYEEYEGYWDKNLEKFCFDTKISWRRNGDNIKPLTGTCSATSTNSTNTSGAVVVFSGAEWFSQMGEWQRIYLWSPESGTDYAIRKNTTDNPTSKTAANGIKVQSREWVDIETVSDANFICLKNCPTAAGVSATAKAALDAIVAQSGTGPHVSPYDATIGAHFKQTDYEAPATDGQINDFWGVGAHYNFQVGDYWNEASVYINDASNADDVALYRIEGGKFYQGTTASAPNEVTWSNSVLTTEVNEVLAVTAGDGTKPYAGMRLDTLLSNHSMKMADWSNTHQYRTRNMGWAIESGFLVENTADNRTKLECDKTGSPAAYHKYGNNKDHPRIVTTKGASATAIRLCYNKIREGFDGTYYRFYLKPRAQWTIKTGGNVVNFFKPETMYFDTSQINTTALEQASGIQDRDKNKIIRLEFSGARQLWGLPGGVWDFCTDQALGDQVYNWNGECYRYIDRFVIPDGLNINTLPDGSGTSYKVKALGIDEFLTPTSNPANIGTMFDGLTKSLLPAETNLKNMGPDGGANSIGTKPADSELEGSGKAQVIHGKKVNTGS